MTAAVPVYNGADLLPRALDSLLAQDYPNLEVVISDNGSTDATDSICRAYEARDARVRYVPSPENRGATWNFNRVIDLARGEYVFWAAHDDVWMPTFVSRCVSALEADDSAVVCHTEAQPIGSGGEPVGSRYAGWVDDLETPDARYLHVLSHWELHAAIYGVMKTAAVRRTRGLRLLLAGDIVFIAEMAIQGKIIQVPEMLQLKRVPDEGEPYHQPGEMLSYLSARRVPRRRLVFQRLRVSSECVRGVCHARPGWRSGARMIAGTVAVYVRARYWSIDAKETMHILVDPDRLARLRRRRRHD